MPSMLGTDTLLHVVPLSSEYSTNVSVDPNKTDPSDDVSMPVHVTAGASVTSFHEVPWFVDFQMFEDVCSHA